MSIPYKDPLTHRALKVNATSPDDAPPTQTLLNSPTGHTALAALTQPSHLPLLTLIVAPLSVASSVNSADPLEPLVDVGAPPHFVIAPAMPPQMLSEATLRSWGLIVLG